MGRLMSGARGQAGAEATQCDQAQSCVGELPGASHDANRKAPRRVEPEGSEDDHLLRAYLGGHEEKHTIDDTPRRASGSAAQRGWSGTTSPTSSNRASRAASTAPTASGNPATTVPAPCAVASTMARSTPPIEISCSDSPTAWTPHPARTSRGYESPPRVGRREAFSVSRPEMPEQLVHSSGRERLTVTARPVVDPPARRQAPVAGADQVPQAVRGCG